MLAPNQRSLFVEALVPPPGYELRDAIATTYSLGLDTLLGVPIHLALAERAIPESLDAAALAILAALRRLAGRITVFAQAGHTSVPSPPHVLYSLLEPVIIEVRREGGAFHSKLWILRFDRPDGTRRIRLLVPTRNVTADRCWDAALTLEGAASGGRKALNAPLAKLVSSLPGQAAAGVPASIAARVDEIAEDLRRTEWDAPKGWELVAFHVLGLGRVPLPIEDSDELLVISPFVSAAAIETLASTTKQARALVSRPEELARLSPSARRQFDQLLVLAECAAADPDGNDELESRLRGLHAKMYVATKRSTTNLWIGSANATTAGLLDGRNVEILVQLRTKGPVRPIDDFLGEGGMGPLLEAFDTKTEPIDETRARERLELARDGLANAPLRVRAVRVDDADDGDASPGARWRAVLEADGPVPIPEDVRAIAWPVSTAHTTAVDIASLYEGRPTPLAATELSLLTGLIAFELREEDEVLTFVRNLPVLDAPSGREADLLHAVIGDRDRFLALMLALFGDGERAFGSLTGIGRGARRAGNSGTGADGAGLLEHLVRACVRDRDRLHEALSLVESLRKSDRGSALVPDGFRELLALLHEVSP